MYLDSLSPMDVRTYASSFNPHNALPTTYLPKPSFFLLAKYTSHRRKTPQPNPPKSGNTRRHDKTRRVRKPFQRFALIYVCTYTQKVLLKLVSWLASLVRRARESCTLEAGGREEEEGRNSYLLVCTL